MRFRDKLLIQTVICLGIFTLVRASSMFGARWIEDIRSAIGEMACANYTIEDIKEKGDKLDVAVNIEVPDAVIEERMSGRRACLKCGATYHVVYTPPKKEGICDNCGSELVQRADDKPETVKARLATYHEQTQPLIDFYKKEGILKEVDGTQSPSDVFKAVMEALS